MPLPIVSGETRCSEKKLIKMRSLVGISLDFSGQTLRHPQEGRREGATPSFALRLRFPWLWGSDQDQFLKPTDESSGPAPLSGRTGSFRVWSPFRRIRVHSSIRSLALQAFLELLLCAHPVPPRAPWSTGYRWRLCLSQLGHQSRRTLSKY